MGEALTDTQMCAMDLLLDDHFALWDLADSYPDFRPQAANSQVGDLIELVERGLITVTFGLWLENETCPVAVENAVQALLDAHNWKPTGRAPGFVLELSPDGIKYLSALGIGLKI